MKLQLTKDDFDYSFPLLVAFSGWMVLLGYLYYCYIEYNQDVFSLIASSGENTNAQYALLIFLAPLSTGIIGYAVNRRLILYKKRYLEESYIKSFAENKLIELADNLIICLVNAVDAKSPWTKGHSLRVRHYSTMIAHELGMSAAEIKLLSIAALLHDIGKIGTYDDVLNKAGALTDEEYAMVKKHPANAVNILAPIKEFTAVLPIIKGHHERMDGRGYPDGLVGKDIPLLARIICIADAYDAITSQRPYKSQMNCFEGLHEIQRNSGPQFDPVIVEAFVLAHGKSSFTCPD